MVGRVTRPQRRDELDRGQDLLNLGRRSCHHSQTAAGKTPGVTEDLLQQRMAGDHPRLDPVRIEDRGDLAGLRPDGKRVVYELPFEGIEGSAEC
jgi:hypothetical protein